MRLTQDPSFNRFDPPDTGFVAETDVAPNTQLGLKMVNRSRPRFGPALRSDGRQSRTRKPAVSFTFRF